MKSPGEEMAFVGSVGEDLGAEEALKKACRRGRTRLGIN